LRKSLVCSREAKITKLRAVILLSLPAIVGTGVFLVLAILSALDQNPAPADPDSWREWTRGENVLFSAVFAIYLAAYIGATLGPLLLPFAAFFAVSLTRANGVRSRVAIHAWSLVVLGLLATALFWGWLTNLDLFI
jgi:hypothetical protein